MVDERADVQDVIATVLDLAERGALQIKEVTVQQPWGPQRDFEMELLDRDLATHDIERAVLDSLFKRGSPIRFAQLGNWFSSGVPLLQEALYNAAVSEDSSPPTHKSAGVINASALS